ncbi:MAG: hypothetical protein JO339_15685, partial [Alphaproteobacteria bacterium]|nr:hypothetical protein [Alphaproteobacteria bacterium]
MPQPSSQLQDVQAALPAEVPGTSSLSRPVPTISIKISGSVAIAPSYTRRGDQRTVYPRQLTVDGRLHMPFTRAMDVPRDQRPIQELDWVRTVLEASGFAVEALTRMQPDSPDCVATLDGERVGIEVTELVSGEARKRTGNWSLFRWDQPSFLTRVQEIIDTKAAKPFQGGPY